MKILTRFFLGPDTYITYPHCNAFAPGGAGLLYMQLREGVLGLFSFDFKDGRQTHLRDVEPLGASGNIAWYDVTLRGRKVAAVFLGGIWMLDLGEPSADWKCVYRPAPGVRLDDLCSVSADGTRVLCGEVHGKVYRAVEIDVATGAARVLFSKTWYANHFHYCPFDESWVAFSHEGPTETIPDRCWVWHPRHAPEGRPAYDQASEEPGTPLCVGHERWGFHDVSAYVPAYAVSPAGKRGLYEVFGDGRPAKLLWENDVVWHCTMNQSGRYAAVDTTGPFREGGLTDEERAIYRERHQRADQEKGTNASDVALLDLRTGEALHVATAMRARHPYHPHPALSPGADWIAWNDASEACRGAWVAAIAHS